MNYAIIIEWTKLCSSAHGLTRNLRLQTDDAERMNQGLKLEVNHLYHTVSWIAHWPKAKINFQRCLWVFVWNVLREKKSKEKIVRKHFTKYLHDKTLMCYLYLTYVCQTFYEEVQPVNTKVLFCPSYLFKVHWPLVWKLNGIYRIRSLQ